MHANIVHHAMTKYSLNKGLRKFQKEGEKAVEKELEQLHMKETFAPVNEGDLTEKQKKSDLESLMFLKEKRDGSIKGRSCADGRKQSEGSTKSDTTSPTVALESVLITATIEAFEKREVAIVDVPGAYLTADMDEEVFMCLRGKHGGRITNALIMGAIYKWCSCYNSGGMVLDSAKGEALILHIKTCTMEKTRELSMQARDGPLIIYALISFAF
jgi:hypothetical protein